MSANVCLKYSDAVVAYAVWSLMDSTLCFGSFAGKWDSGVVLQWRFVLALKGEVDLVYGKTWTYA